MMDSERGNLFGSEIEEQLKLKERITEQINQYRESLLNEIKQHSHELQPPSLAEEFEATVTKKFDKLMRQIRLFKPGLPHLNAGEVSDIVEQVKKGIFFDNQPGTPPEKRLVINPLIFDREVSRFANWNETRERVDRENKPPEQKEKEDQEIKAQQQIFNQQRERQRSTEQAEKISLRWFLMSAIEKVKNDFIYEHFPVLFQEERDQVDAKLSRCFLLIEDYMMYLHDDINVTPTEQQELTESLSKVIIFDPQKEAPSEQIRQNFKEARKIFAELQRINSDESQLNETNEVSSIKTKSKLSDTLSQSIKRILGTTFSQN